MFRFKYLSVVLFAAIVAVVVVSCKDNDKEDPKAEGIKAGNEMCDCVGGYTAPNFADYIDDPAGYQAAFMAYAGELYECIGVIGKYQKYVTPDLDAYDETSSEPLLSVFKFENNDFKNGFREGVASCSNAFDALWELFKYQ
jgi:hypothetical protein